jgi:hypothetical protein
MEVIDLVINVHEGVELGEQHMGGDERGDQI